MIRIVGLLLLLLGTIALGADNLRLKRENALLRDAFSVILERHPYSCELADGERAICAVHDGVLSRITLDPRDQVVSTTGRVSKPIGKRKLRRHVPPPKEAER